MQFRLHREEWTWFPLISIWVSTFEQIPSGDLNWQLIGSDLCSILFWMLREAEQSLMYVRWYMSLIHWMAVSLKLEIRLWIHHCDGNDNPVILMCRYMHTLGMETGHPHHLGRSSLRVSCGQAECRKCHLLCRIRSTSLRSILGASSPQKVTSSSAFLFIVFKYVYVSEDVMHSEEISCAWLSCNWGLNDSKATLHTSKWHE